MIIYGKNPVFEAAKADKIEKVYIRKGTALYNVDFNAAVEIMDKREFDSRFAREAQGVAAEVPELTTVNLKDAMDDIVKEGKAVILDRIQDPHNYGAIIRSAHCFGVKHIIVPRYQQAPVTPSVFKASAGAIFYTTIVEETNLSNVCIALKREGFKIAACDMDGTSLKEVKPEGPLALIIGSEGKGLRQSLGDVADVVVSIPMQGSIDSLNASASAAITLYEFFG